MPRIGTTCEKFVAICRHLAVPPALSPQKLQASCLARGALSQAGAPIFRYNYQTKNMLVSYTENAQGFF